MIKSEQKDFGRGIGVRTQIVQKVPGGTAILGTLERHRGGYISDSMPGWFATKSEWKQRYREVYGAVSAK